MPVRPSAIWRAEAGPIFGIDDDDVALPLGLCVNRDLFGNLVRHYLSLMVVLAIDPDRDRDLHAIDNFKMINRHLVLRRANARRTIWFLLQDEREDVVVPI
jgi:hypothetical protein